LNEEDEDGADGDESEAEQNEPHRQPHRSVANRYAVQAGVGAGVNVPPSTATKARSPGRRLAGGPKGFELDMGNATLLGRRHNKRSSPLAGKPVADSPLKLENLRVGDI
jgi:hypothetical protein